MNKITADASYQSLLADIRREIARGVMKIQDLLERQKIFSYWAIGRRINQYLSSIDHHQGMIGPFYRKLSHDLNINERTLQQCEQFFRYFHRVEHHKNLSWSHYRYLLTVQDPAKRQAWLNRLKKEKIPANQLRVLILPPAQPHHIPGILKEPERGRLYLYGLIPAIGIDNFDVPWFVDLGFAGLHEAPASRAKLTNRSLYTSEKINGNYHLKITDARVAQLFTYRAVVRKVIDGDTILVDVDQGFSCWTNQRLRLKAIDAPEPDTLAGRRSRKWLEDQLKHSPNLVIKTYKSDNWDRYLVDIFYLPKEKDLQTVASQGKWLNGQMVHEGLAKVW